MEIRSRPVSGFTLLELMVAVALVAILVAVAIPSYQSLRQEQMVRAATQALYTDMMLLKSEAIKRNKNLSLIVFRSGLSDWCYRIDIDDDGNCDSCDDSCSSIDGRKGGDATDFPSITLTWGFNNSKMTFSPRRGTANAGGIVLQSGDYKSRVKISDIGRVSACALSNNLGGLEPCS
ncbi:GspH/FimT family pseudopilin [Aeromonas media]|uniref:GspH/FimT family pseudopilin n=1 Tax=Aeromonas media TaxID=651 RepID=UPI0029545FB2|nr:GspH/FimT family pseudopilin [Aeromonas media]WOQ13907.1 GspH/FimT family pseudopilin [Aeromonas media]